MRLHVWGEKGTGHTYQSSLSVPIGPVHNLVVNAEVFIDSVNCNNNMSFALMKTRHELMTEPVKQLIRDFKVNVCLNSTILTIHVDRRRFSLSHVGAVQHFN